MLTMHIGAPYEGSMLCGIDITKAGDDQVWAYISDLVINHNDLKPHVMCPDCATVFQAQFVEDGTLE